MMKDLIRVIILTLILVVLAACGNQIDQDVELTEDIYKHLEETVVIEEDFEVLQIEINKLEKSDQVLYEEMTELGNDDLDEISEIANEAIGLLEERLSLVKSEKEILVESKEEFLKIEPLIEKLEAESKKTIAENLSDAMNKRYDSYDVVYEKYTASILKTEELYNLFKDEEFNEEAAYSLIADVNDSYNEITEANEQFNEFTISYNEYKKELYDVLNEEEVE